jgi:hypothetical protein
VYLTPHGASFPSFIDPDEALHPLDILSKASRADPDED